MINTKDLILRCPRCLKFIVWDNIESGKICRFCGYKQKEEAKIKVGEYVNSV